MSGDLRALAEAADGGWGPDGWYAEHELRHGLRGTSTDLDADVAYLRAASPDAILALLDERDALARWKAEALPIFDGMQDLGRALGIPLGVLVTGPPAVEAATALRAARDQLAATVASVEAWALGEYGHPGPPSLRAVLDDTTGNDTEETRE